MINEKMKSVRHARRTPRIHFVQFIKSRKFVLELTRYPAGSFGEYVEVKRRIRPIFHPKHGSSIRLTADNCNLVHSETQRDQKSPIFCKGVTSFNLLDFKVELHK